MNFYGWNLDMLSNNAFLPTLMFFKLFSSLFLFIYSYGWTLLSQSQISEGLDVHYSWIPWLGKQAEIKWKLEWGQTKCKVHINRHCGYLDFEPGSRCIFSKWLQHLQWTKPNHRCSTYSFFIKISLSSSVLHMNHVRESSGKRSLFFSVPVCDNLTRYRYSTSLRQNRYKLCSFL